MTAKKINQLAEVWEQRARSAFRNAELETDEFGRRFIEHGAVCYANLSQGNDMIKIEIDNEAKSKVSEAISRLQDARPLFRGIAGSLESETLASL